MTDSPNTTGLSDLKAASERLRVARIALGLTEEQAAADFSVSPSTYRRYEAGHLSRYAVMDGFDAFCHKHDLSIDWLLLGDPTWVRVRHIKGRVTILKTQGARMRHAELAQRISDLLPRDRVNALDVIDAVRSIIDWPTTFPDGGQVVRLPSA